LKNRTVCDPHFQPKEFSVVGRCGANLLCQLSQFLKDFGSIFWGQNRLIDPGNHLLFDRSSRHGGLIAHQHPGGNHQRHRKRQSAHEKQNSTRRTQGDWFRVVCCFGFRHVSPLDRQV